VPLADPRVADAGVPKGGDGRRRERLDAHAKHARCVRRALPERLGTIEISLSSGVTHFAPPLVPLQAERLDQIIDMRAREIEALGRLGDVQPVSRDWRSTSCDWNRRVAS
jgi:hypothetical protein